MKEAMIPVAAAVAAQMAVVTRVILLIIPAVPQAVRQAGVEVVAAAAINRDKKIKYLTNLNIHHDLL